MREIKFRAWCTEAKMWLQITGFETAETKKSNGYTLDGMFHDGDFVGRKGIVLMQSTGLKDKNGVEIYEGDILLFNNSHNGMNNKWKCVVKYREGGFVCEYPIDGVYNHFDSWNVPKVTWEIIGNIHDNPELLGDGRARN